MKLFRHYPRRTTGALIGVLVVLTLGIGVLPGLPPAGRIRAQQPTRAGLVVEYGDGRIETFCVDTGDAFGVSAEELLLSAPIEVQMFREYGNTAVCRIGGEGCPAEECYCAYAGDAPQSRLWLSYRLRNGAWQRPEPAEVHLSRRRVFPGDVEAWVWGYPGDGHGQGAARPSRVVSFAEICAAATPTTTPTATPTSTDTPAPNDTPAPTDTQPPTATILPAPEEQSRPPEVNPPIVLPAASPTRQPLPTFVRPSPTATVPPRESGASDAIHLPLVRGAARETPPPAVTPQVVIAEPSPTLPMPSATLSPTPGIDLTATAAILQTELAVPATRPAPTDAGEAAGGASRPAMTPTVPSSRAPPAPGATQGAAGGAEVATVQPEEPPAYPAPPAIASRSFDLPASFFLWLALGVAVYLLALLALILAQRRARRSLDDDDALV